MWLIKQMGDWKSDPRTDIMGRPGEPLWVEKTLRSSGEVAPSHSLHRVHFEAFTRGNGIQRCSRGSEYYCADSGRAEYTNNPAMYRTAWVRKGGGGLGEMLARDDYNTMEVCNPAAPRLRHARCLDHTSGSHLFPASHHPLVLPACIICPSMVYFRRITTLRFASPW